MFSATNLMVSTIAVGGQQATFKRRISQNMGRNSGYALHYFLNLIAQNDFNKFKKKWIIHQREKWFSVSQEYNIIRIQYIQRD